eukprot:TRINITY_DN6398_c0_g1_i2.p2 TRINITY_DN6398_c0_g1~~TRINITY_DN6398_c0_g1_i2.p2  ORF type:complete len:180 (+),score=65.82 TRINITY_DN6398_c0_g1_i2:192-731(+)
MQLAEDKAVQQFEESRREESEEHRQRIQERRQKFQEEAELAARLEKERQSKKEAAEEARRLAEEHLESATSPSKRVREFQAERQLPSWQRRVDEHEQSKTNATLAGKLRPKEMAIERELLQLQQLIGTTSSLDEDTTLNILRQAVEDPGVAGVKPFKYNYKYKYKALVLDDDNEMFEES